MTDQNRILPSSAVHWRVGDATLTSLSDGYIDLPFEPFVTNVAIGEAVALQRRALRGTGEFRMDVNVYLVTSARHEPILIDAGMGVGMFPTCGRLPASLAGVNVKPAEIRTVLLTHLHGDHCGGLVDSEGNAVFPNAELVLHRREHRYWLDGVAVGGQAAPDPQGVQIAKRALAPYLGRLRLIDDEATEVAPGIAAVPIAGHTPGQTGFQLGTGASSVLVWGDLVNLPFVQSALPEAGFVSDVDAALSVATRRRIMDRATVESFLVAGMHIEFPGLAQVVRDGSGYQLVPAHWVSRQ
jgi:glyoxylase-like metal-dependent hydrolase (beta-lactamase superfamily II)